MTTDEYRKQCEWLADFYAKAASTGRQMQMRCEKWQDYDRGPNMQSPPDEWRLKPEPQKVWLVWLLGGNSCKFDTKQEADHWCNRHGGGTIQEIARPEPQ